MVVIAAQVKELREKTGVGLLDCRNALQDSDGDMNRAIIDLRQKGLLDSKKRQGRKTNQGAVVSYIHHGNQAGALIQLGCETDFVSKNSEFVNLALQLAMHITASSPQWVQQEDIPEAALEVERTVYKKQAEGKIPEVADKIIAGKLKKFAKENCLLMQPYIKDDKKTVEQLIQEYIAKFGENITVKRFVRFKVGEDE